jgi:hypothetical protein
MNLLFDGRTHFAGKGKTGIRWQIAEQLSHDGCLVFGWHQDHDALGNELQQVATAARIIDLSWLLNELGVTLSDPAERSVIPFERWMGGPEYRTVFLARGSEVEVPVELLDETLAVLANLAQPAIPIFARQHPFSELASLTAFLIRPVR